MSFQRDLAAFQHVTHLPGWLGDVNFGGGPARAERVEPAPLRFITLQAGGFFAPPRHDPFPGAELFGRG